MAGIKLTVSALFYPCAGEVYECKETESRPCLKRSCCCSSCRWGETMSLSCDHEEAYCSLRMIFLYGEQQWSNIDRGKQNDSENKLPSTTLSATNPTWNDPDAYPGLRGERSTTLRIRWLIDYVDEARLSQNRGHQRACCSSPRWYVSMESHGDDDAGWRKLLTRPPELSVNPTSWIILEQVGGMDEGMRILPISVWTTSRGP
jgi:hypothetical protein